MNLAELQALFQTSVLAETPSPRLLSLLHPPPRAEKAAETFAVYHDGFRLRMIEFLSTDFPVLRAALGELAFDAMVEAFWRARPSTFRNARWIGAGLPDFLRDTPPFCDDGFVRGLAALEEGLSRSFDAEDAAALPIEALAAIREADWPRLCLVFDPSVLVIDTDVAALAAYEAAQAGEPLPQPAAAGAMRLLIWRREWEVSYRALEDDEALALIEAMSGAPFEEICSLLAFARSGRDGEPVVQTAAGFLAQWFADGMIVAVEPKTI